MNSNTYSSADFQDELRWRSFCNDCVKELGALSRVQETHMRFVVDGVRVKVIFQLFQSLFFHHSFL